MFTGNYFATSYFPDPYFFGAEVDSEDLYANWLSEGQPRYFMHLGVVYLAINNPTIRFIKIERGANIDPADQYHAWDQFYGPRYVYVTGRQR